MVRSKMEQTAYAITFDTTDFSNGVTLSNSSRLNASQAGIYNIQFSIQVENTTSDTQDIDIWFRKNGTDIAKSNNVYGLPPRKAAGDPSHCIVTLNFFISIVYIFLRGCEHKNIQKNTVNAT